jgi:hypothetical protein
MPEYTEGKGRTFRLKAPVLKLGFSYLSSSSLPAIAQPVFEHLTGILHESPDHPTGAISKTGLWVPELKRFYSAVLKDFILTSRDGTEDIKADLKELNIAQGVMAREKNAG